jgi:large subunit ribosomal protein L9
MKVILLDNIRGIGRIGDVKEVADGYARNFLLARGKARPATSAAARDAETLMARKREALGVAREEAESLRAKMTGLSVTVGGAANAKGTLFAAVDPGVIAEKLSSVLHVRIDPLQIHPTDHLKTVGEHTIGISLPGGVTGQMTVVVEALKR